MFLFTYCVRILYHPNYLRASIVIPAALYTSTYFYFEERINNNTLDYNTKSIYFFLDLRAKVIEKIN